MLGGKLFRTRINTAAVVMTTDSVPGTGSEGLGELWNEVVCSLPESDVDHHSHNLL